MWGLNLILMSLVLQSVLIYSQSPGPSGPLRTAEMRVEFDITEELPKGSIVGKIPIKSGFIYRFNENVQEFQINGTTGEIRTAQVIDREILQSDRFDLVVLSSQPTYPIEVRIQVIDENDHSPSFPESYVRVSFSESATPGTRVFLDTAEDPDKGINGVTDEYKILDGNEDDHFRLGVSSNPSGEAPFLYLETTGKLDRETNPFYKLNISARDGGIPRRIGFLFVEVSIIDVNDNPPIFDHSDYVVSLNESVSIGTPVLQVVATDNDDGDNAKITYYFGESETQFSVDSESGLISTMQPSLNCQQNCPQHQINCPKSCVFTVFARDHGVPRQDGRTYVTVNLLDANDHDPVIKFRYFPETASAATVDENAQNGSVVGAISILDSDEGLNGETEVEIISGNELKHFRLESTPLFQLVRVNGVLDREKIGKYNLSISATDKGSPPRSVVSFLLIEVNDINDHEPIFKQTEYSAVLRELVPIGTFVASISADDEDTGINSQVYYSIVSGNTGDWFGIDTQSGLLTTKSKLDREEQDTVRLKISARDGGPNPKWAYSEIKITILDENDEKPMFENEKISVSLSEAAPLGSLITTISASDHDQGTNGSVSYHLAPQVEDMYPNLFHLDSTTGSLVNKMKFDREVVPSYEILVIAKDKGSPPLSSTSTVSLIILDVNDNEPVFYPREYFLTLSKHTPINTVVLQLSASDMDEGKNSKLTFDFELDETKIFTIDSSTGIIKLKENLATLSMDYFTLRVEVKDGGGLKGSENAIIHVLRLDTLDESEPLEFLSKEFKFRVTEDSGILNGMNAEESKEIGKLSLRSDKIPGFQNLEGVVKYSILNGDPNNVFRVDNEGVLYSVKPLDREVKVDYSLSVLVRNRNGRSSDYGKCTVRIFVNDLNDHAPIFNINKPEVEIDENVAIGSEVFLVQATDGDDGENSTIRFSLVQNPDEIFRIDSTNGLITLRKSLYGESSNPNRFNSDIYNRILTIELVAQDSGTPPLSSHQQIIVKVRDVNNFIPVFDHSSYETSILESTPLNARFFTLTASDKDLGLNSQISYEILDGNGAEKFGIFPDGNLFVKKILDREDQDYFSLTVMAKDGGDPSRSSTVPVVVHVIDENDNAPKFTNSTFTLYISENEEPDTFVGKLSGIDNDIGRNAELTYSIPTVQKDFLVDPRSGFVRSLKSFDREKLLQTIGQDFLSFEVIVQDGGTIRLKDTAHMRVYIEDDNDNSPIFLKKSYSAQISEGAPIGSQVVRVLASDMDEGLNGDIIYYFTETDEEQVFRIDPSTGQITVSKNLDRETVSEYTLSVTAQDMAESRSLSSMTTVFIEILDENDNEPEFVQSEPFISVIETTPVNRELMQFQATDPDLGLNQLVTLSITGGNKHEVFRIDPKSGSLYLNKPLDFEKYSSYTLNITASDTGNPKLSSFIQFLIKIEDFNDNAPIFPSTAIVRQIQEGIPTNTSIVTISADDLDSGLNGKVKYSILDQEPPGEYFGIDPEEGRIFTQREIDREFTDSFRLTVVAMDQAIPILTRLSAQKLVTIIVDDINDNEPHYTSMNAVILKRGTLGSTEVMKIRAIDPDSESNGVVTYEMTSGDSSLFKLNRNTGVLSLRRSVTEIQPRNQLTIRATDEAIQSQRKFSDLYLTVLGIESRISESNLSFSVISYNGSIYENEPIGTSVLRVNGVSGVEAFLGDIEYYITNITSSKSGKMQDRLFDIDVRRGIISTTSILDRELGVSKFELEVYAILVSSKGLHTANTKVDIEILDRNDSPPKFKERKKQLNISESAPVDFEIVTLVATDEDTLGNVSYSIVGGSSGKFQIGIKSGVLRIQDPLDREEKEEYLLIIRASDGLQHSDITLVIQVLDENDNPPSFSNNGIYSFDIREDASEGFSVGGLEGVDPDKGVNGVITYSVLSDWGNDVFALNSETGVFTLTSRVDYEDVQHYVFVVQAQDAGVPLLSSTATVYLNIIDLNDNSPVFDPMSYTREVFENVSIGSSVLRLSATDLDSGLNGEIRYSILAGNNGGSLGISDNGTIFTIKSLDRETVSSYSLTVKATDQGHPNQLSSTVQVTIILRDVNDEDPLFISPNETIVMENQLLNTVVLVVKAVDPDEGRNGYVEYVLTNEKSTFTLGSVDGLLRVNGIIDRESRQNYTLKITARDKGEPSRFSTQILFIRIEDSNDNSPTFDPRQYSAAIPENSSLGISVLQVSATDVDEGLNGQIRYSIVDGDPNHDFMIGDDSGLIRLSKNLNFERKQSYILTVHAEDSGEQARYDTASVFITIVNVNDNPPIFLDSPYIAYVRENMGDVPGRVLRVSAYDADATLSQQLRYLIKDGDKSIFRINASSGEISIHRQLDRETQSEYLLTVVAMDGGSPRLTGTGMVRIRVTDTNDNPPTFEHERYEFFVRGNSPPGTNVSRVFATDADEGLNAKIKYYLQGPGPFVINENSGEIKTTAEMDRQIQQAFHLILEARDSNPINQLKTFTNLTIRVENPKNNLQLLKVFQDSTKYAVTIPDGSGPGTFVFGVSTDSMIPSTRSKFYLGGVDADKFQIDQMSGVVKTLKTVRLMGGATTFQLEIHQSDETLVKDPSSSMLSLEVELSDSKGFPTVRFQKTFFTFSENTRNMHVTKIEPISPKSGLTFGIGGGNLGNSFQVDKISGEIRISTTGLDYELTPEFELWILTWSETRPKLVTALSLRINVTDKNDNEPTFDQSAYQLRIQEEENGPKYIATLRATDMDSGENGAVRYRLSRESEATFGHLFEIEKISGEIFAKSKLDREDVSQYALTVEAIDLGNPSQTGTTSLVILVDDKNDNPPRFTRLFSVNVTENVQAGTFVVQVTSVDKDIGENANSSYIFTEPTGGHPFKIDPVSGNITVVGMLDREVQDEYLIRVAAIDGSWRAETLVTITIQDINDNSPEFDQSFYSFNIAEDNQQVSFVGQVIAFDKDKRGPNSMVTYELKQSSDFFSIDPISGEIFTKRRLQYKTSRRKESPENVHSLVVIAADGGKPSLSSEASISINIVDSNNSPPKFLQSSYSAAVLESTTSGERVIQIEAKDLKDVGLNAQLEYFILRGNGTELFSIDKNSGWVTVNSDLKGRKFQKFLLEVKVVDKGIPPLSAQVTLTLTVTGPNIYPPVFSSPNYRVIVPENEAIGTTIVTLAATDADTGPNGQIRYNITSGNEDGHFQIDPTTAAVSTRQVLDYENRKEYNLKIGAKDMAYHSLESEAELTILLTDVNDNAPYFLKSSYRGEIKENALINTFLIQLEAVDKDSTKYAQIHYAIVGGSGKSFFNMNQSTGVIIAKKRFDYEERREYELEVMGSNPDSSLFGTTLVHVAIVGENEYYPRFVQPVFQFTVSESAPLGSFVGSVEAKDEDSGPDGVVYYLFVGSSNDRGFVVNSNTGVITVSRRLDRESQSRVVLTVLSKNAGSIRGNDIDEAQVIITVQDGNDPPVFQKNLYEITVAEGLPSGTHVISVEAEDIDVRPSNNRFSYEILQGNQKNNFRIDSLTGSIYTVSVLDREMESAYTLTIGAVDIGDPPQTGTTTLQVTVVDKNDNGPILDELSREGSILENGPPGTRILTLKATDSDLPSNGAPFTFSLVQGSSKVKVDSNSGVVTSAVSFDREITPEFTFQVSILDSGNPPMASVQEVKVNVMDVNDNPSTPRNAQVLLYLFQNEIPKVSVGLLEPIDPDLVGHYTCHLERSLTETFSFRNSNCSLFLNKIPSFTRQSLKIISSDGRHGEVTSTVVIDFHSFDNTTLENSIILRIGGRSPEKILEENYSKLISLFRQIFRSEPHIYSLVPHLDGTDLIITVDTEDRKMIMTSLTGQKSSLERLLDGPITIDYSPCGSLENVCQNQATSCSYSLKTGPSRLVTQSPLLILSTPEVRTEVTCECSDGFEGPQCQYRKQPCLPNPCESGGTCTKSGYDFICACSPHRYGNHCELERSNACEINPCRNGGTCNQDHTLTSSYFCLCRPGFLGRQCQLTASDACKPNPCQNGGECVSGGTPSTSSQPKCKCPPQFYGKYCEKSGYGFSFGSFMTFPSLDPNTNDITIVFSTNKNNSLLLYNYGEQTGGRSDFIAIELLNGRPTLSFGGSRTAVGTVSINKVVSDGKWHRITAIRNSRVISLSVSECEESGEYCKDCRPGDSACSVDDVGHTGTLSFNGNPLYIGGVASVGPILERLGQVHTDDFIGCVHSLEVNGRGLNMSSPLTSRGVSEKCHRIPDMCSPAKHSCGSGECIDLWDSFACRCSDVVAPNCDDALSSYTFKHSGFLEFRMGEKYKRNQLLQNVRLNYPDEKLKPDDGLPSKILSFNFRTYEPTGVIFFAATNQDYTLLQLNNGGITFSTKVSTNYPINMTVPNLDLFDGEWHNVRLHRQDQVLQLYIDGQKHGDDLNSASSHDFLDPYLTSIMLGGVHENFNLGKLLPHFDGCIGNFSINQQFQPLNASGSLLGQSIQYGHVVQGCSNALGTASAPDPLSIGVTLVITFFVLLLVAILVSFVVFRLRKTEKGPLPAVPKQTPTSQTDVIRNNMVDNGNETETIRHFVRNSKKMGDGSRGYQKPDIIERSNSTPSHNLSNSLHSSMGNGVSLEPDLSELPEHYDLENASSIAPSDIDIVYHYKGYRENLGRRTNSSPFAHSHHFPVNRQSPGVRQSPISNVLKSTPLARLSPSSELSQQTAPRILTLQDISGKPYQSALLHQKDGMSPSERSLNISQSSARSSIVNPSCQGKKKRKTRGEGGSNSMSIGLTAEEIERLNNSRHKNNSSLVSTMDVVSSSSEEEMKQDHHPNQEMTGPRPPPNQNTSSEDGESGNDSFSCSEFEYDGKKRGNFRQPSHLMVTKRGPEKVEGEESYRGSLSTLVASDEDLSYINGYRKSAPGGNDGPPAESWNYLMNWGGPNYSPLTSVFKNIPDMAEPHTTSNGPPIPFQSNQSHAINNLGSSTSRGNRYPTPRPNEEYV